MVDDKNRNLLFAVLAVQLKGVSPDRAMEAAAAWLINPDTPLSAYLEQLAILPAADIKLLGTLVEEIVKSFEGDAEEALKSLPGGTELSLTLIGQAIPASHETRPMVGDLPPGMHVIGTAPLEELPGRYSQLSEHGRGGMGRVLLVHDELFGREIALKELLLPHDTDYTGPAPSPMGQASSLLGRFLQEARITGQLEHPSIVPVYEIGRRLNGTFYYTMKLMRGKTLARAIRDCKSLEERLRILPSILDLCQALAYAHSRRVIHRDIKPANAMIGEFGETVLLDWGLAKIRGAKDVYSEKMKETLRSLKVMEPDKTPQTVAGEAIGTPHYMPPEQARGDIEGLDERSDVYSMGAVLYETLTGNPPFEGATARAIILQVLNIEPKPIESFAPEAPPELAAICRKAMAKLPENRYQSMIEFRDELIRFQTGAFVQSYRYNLREALRLYYRRHRVGVHATVTALAVVLLVGLWSYVSIWQARAREHDQRIAAETAHAQAEAARSEAETARGEAVSSRDLALHQTYLAQIRLAQSQIEDQQMRLANEALEKAPVSERDWVWKYLHNKANAAMFRVRSEKSVIFQALYDPTGKYIVALRTPETPGLWKAEDGKFIRNFEGDTERYNFATFNKDGTRFAAIGDGGVLDIWDVETGIRLQHLSHPTEGVALAFDPSATRVWAGYIGGPLVEWDIETGQAVRTLDTGGRTVGGLYATAVSNVLLSVCSAVQATGAPKIPNAIVAWDTVSGKIRYELEGISLWQGPEGKTFIRSAEIALLPSIAPNPDPQAKPEFRSRLALYDTATGNPLAEFDGQGANILDVSFGADGQQFVSASEDGSARLWSMDQTGPVAEIYSPVPFVRAFLTDAQNQVLGCSGENRVSVWAFDSGIQQLDLPGENKLLSTAEVSPDRQRIVTTSATHTFEVFATHLPQGYLALAQGVHGTKKANRYVSDFVLSHDEGAAAVELWGDATKTIQVANLQTLEWVAQFEAEEGVVPRTALSPDGGEVAYCKSANEIAIGNVDTGMVTILASLPEPISALAISPSGRLVASATGGDKIIVWDLASRAEYVTFASMGTVHAITISPDDTQIVAGCEDGHLRVYETASGTLKNDIATHAGRVVDVALQRSGSLAASVGFDGAVVVTDMATSRQRFRIGANESYTEVMDSRFTVRFSHTEKYLLIHKNVLRTLIVDARDGDVLLQPSEETHVELLQDENSVLSLDASGAIALSSL